MKQMITEEDMTEEFLNKFPTIVHNTLEDEKHKARFLNRVYKTYEDVVVYRGLHRENEICEDDFICDVLESERYNRTLRPPLKIEHYAISVNEDLDALKLSLRFPNKTRPILGIAKGTMKCLYGPADAINTKTHHNWFLFENEINKMKDRFVIIKENKEGEDNDE